MTADLLRRAAAKIREVAHAATPGPWAYEVEPWKTRVLANVEHPLLKMPAPYPVGASILGEGNAAHIATWSPDVAELVARLLEYTDRFAPRLCEERDAANALARRILGEA